MTNPKVLIHNIETNEILEREMTSEEFAKWHEDQDQMQAEKEFQSAQKAALLEKLGITVEEAKLLLS